VTGAVLESAGSPLIVSSVMENIFPCIEEREGKYNRSNSRQPQKRVEPAKERENKNNIMRLYYLFQ